MGARHDGPSLFLLLLVLVGSSPYSVTMVWSEGRAVAEGAWASAA